MSVKIALEEYSPQIARIGDFKVAVLVVKSVVLVVSVLEAVVVVTGHVYASHGQPLGQPAY